MPHNNPIKVTPATPPAPVTEQNVEISKYSAVRDALLKIVDPLRNLLTSVMVDISKTLITRLGFLVNYDTARVELIKNEVEVDSAPAEAITVFTHFPDKADFSRHPSGEPVSTADAIEFKLIHYQAALQVVNDLIQTSAGENPGEVNSLDQFPSLFDKATQSLREKQISDVSFDKTFVKKNIGGKQKQSKMLDVFRNFSREQTELIQLGSKGTHIPENTQHVHIRTALASVIHGKFRSMGLNPKDISIESLDQKIFKRYIDLLHTKEWDPIVASNALQFSGPDNSIKTLQFRTTMTPAKHLDSILKRSYESDGVNGICSYAIEEPLHAVNLWRTEFLPDQIPGVETKHKFSGIRHGVHDAYGMKDATARDTANNARVQEFVHASLLDYLSRNAIDPSALDLGQTLELPIVSVNLLTPVTKEKTMIAQQQLALKRANGTEIAVLISDSEGKEYLVKVKPQVVTFNTPVNHVALSRMGNMLGVWRTADSINTDAMIKLIGPFKPSDSIGGMTGERLQNLREKLSEAKGNSPSQQNKVQELEQKIELIEKLVTQIRGIFVNKAHHQVGNEPYKLPTRLLALANEIGATPAFNCKSGKDRTGQLNVEIRDLYAHLHATNGQLREVDAKREGLELANYQNLFFSGGDREIQILNTGVAGSKSQLPYYNQLMGVTPETIDDIKGLSKWVGT